MKAHLLKLGIAFVAFAVGAFALAIPAMAANVLTSLTMTSVQDISLSSSSISFAPTVDDFNNGITVTPQSTTATIKSNVAWTLKISGSSSTWDTNSKPVTDIKWATTSGGSYTALAFNSPATVTSGSATPSSGTPQAVYFKVALSFALDTPATYHYTNIVFTLSNP